MLQCVAVVLQCVAVRCALDRYLRSVCAYRLFDIKVSSIRKCVVLESYGVATVSRIDKIIGLFCRILSLL